MSDDEFHTHLSKLLSQSEEIELPSVMPTTNLEDMGSYLKHSYSRIKGQESRLLKEYLQHGNDLIQAPEKIPSVEKRKQV